MRTGRQYGLPCIYRDNSRLAEIRRLWARRSPSFDHFVARAVREAQQEITVARRRHAEADKILATQLPDRAQQVMLIAQPCFMLGDDRRPIAVAPDLKRIAPFAAPANVDGARRNSDSVFVQYFAHLPLLCLEPLNCERRRPADRVGAPSVTGALGLGRARRGTAQPLTCGVTRYDGTALRARSMSLRTPLQTQAAAREQALAAPSPRCAAQTPPPAMRKALTHSLVAGATRRCECIGKRPLCGLLLLVRLYAEVASWRPVDRDGLAVSNKRPAAGCTRGRFAINATTRRRRHGGSMSRCGSERSCRFRRHNARLRHPAHRL